MAGHLSRPPSKRTSVRAKESFRRADARRLGCMIDCPRLCEDERTGGHSQTGWVLTTVAISNPPILSVAHAYGSWGLAPGSQPGVQTML